MEKAKKLVTMAILLSMIASFGAIHHAFALHNANVYWIGASEPCLIMTHAQTDDTLVLRSWQWNDIYTINVTFRVHYVSGADIIRVQLHIWEENNRALFHYLKAEAGSNWETRILEKDAYGWARLIEFYAKEVAGTFVEPININYPDRNFTIVFGRNSSKVEPTEYPFAVTTIDKEGGSVEHTIYLMFDTLPPIIQTQPIDGAVVHGIMVPCGDHYFVLNVTAYDDPKVDTGISEAFVAIDYQTIYSNRSVGIGPGGNWTLPLLNGTIWNLKDGTHTLNVTVLDGVGNNQTVIINFTYVEPLRPRVTINPESGYAAPKSWYNVTKGLLESEQKVYKDKVLGTKVKVTGERFEANAKVTVTVTLPYGEYIVNTTIVRADGTFETWFIFPKAPLGNYSVNVYSKPCNFTLQNGKSAKFNVLPQIIYEPDEVIGPALVNVEATGFIKPDMIPETGKIFILCNEKDTLQGVNFQAMFNWYIDGNGTLQNMITLLTGRPTECGLYWPALEPGTYNVTLFLATTGSYWNLNHWEPVTNFEHTNIITVKETLGLLIKIKEDTAYIRKGVESINATLDQLKPVITRIDNRVAYINTTIGPVKATLDQLKPVITRIDGNVANITTSVGANLVGKVDSISGDVMLIKTDVGDIKAVIPNLTMPIYIAAILSLIAAIAAIACAILVYRKIA